MFSYGRCSLSLSLMADLLVESLLRLYLKIMCLTSQGNDSLSTSLSLIWTKICPKFLGCHALSLWNSQFMFSSTFSGDLCPLHRFGRGHLAHIWARLATMASPRFERGWARAATLTNDQQGLHSPRPMASKLWWPSLAIIKKKRRPEVGKKIKAIYI